VLSSCVTNLIQVCGGSISLIIGANVWSSNANNGVSTISVGATIVSGLSAIFRNVSVFGSRASASATIDGTRRFCCSAAHNF
jgi:hypothetical protein